MQRRRIHPAFAPARFALRPLAAACLMLGALPVYAQISSSGAVHVYPDNMVLGPGDTDVGNNRIGVGQSAFGSLDVAGNTVLRAGSLSVANGAVGTGTVTLRNAGSRIDLTGDGNMNRLEVGNWGVGSMTISDGAVFDGRANATACLLGARFCNNFIGNGAGSDGTLTVTGAGSSASFLRAFVVGGTSVFGPPIENFTFGTPGGTTQGRVNVLNGAQMRTESARWGVGPGGSIPTGRERSFADIAISGPGSVWTVQGGSLEANAAFVSTATHANAWASVNIDNGGKLRFEGAPSFYNGLNLTTGGGRTDLTLSGTGSSIEFATTGSVLQVGRSNGSANMQVQQGATVDGLWYLAVGRDGANGQMTIDGAGSKVSIGRTGPAGTVDAGAGGGAQIGRNGQGTLTVSNGGRLEIVNDSLISNRGAYLQMGRDPASSGTLNIRGAGSVVSLSAASVVVDGGPSEAANPVVSVGHDGSGKMEVSGGGKLLVHGGAVSTVADSRSTVLNIGGFSETQGGGKGVALVTGAGSEVRLTGSDTFIGIGRGPNSTGQLTIADQALVSTTIMNVGRVGVGILEMNNATLNLSGQHTGNVQSGAALSIGNREGTGIASITNGSRINITNLGSAGASLNLGGTGPNPLGEGSMTLAGGSQVKITAANGNGVLSVGRDGTGFLRLKEASSIDVGDGSVYVGRMAGSDGTVILTGGSNITAGFVGVGRSKTGDGGTGTMVINNSTLSAQTIEIGANGYLGGNGTIIGDVTNYGIFNPGNSPGTFVIDGSFTNGAGGRLFIEVEDDGQGGFNTDKFVFTNGSSLDLSGAQVVFRFLGDTDANAFQASGGFDIDTFFRLAGPNGESDLSHDLFDQVSFAARADSYEFEEFTFTADGGAEFKVAVVPEPGTWALMAAGLGVMGMLARRRRMAGRSN